MKLSSLQVNLSQLLIRHHDACGIAIGVQVGLNAQAVTSGCVGDQIDNDFETGQWLSTPVDRNVTEQTVFDLVPFAGPGREVKGRLVYLYRAIDREGNLVDVLLSERRDKAAAEAFFRSARTVTVVSRSGSPVTDTTPIPKPSKPN